MEMQLQSTTENRPTSWLQMSSNGSILKLSTHDDYIFFVDNITFAHCSLKGCSIQKFSLFTLSVSENQINKSKDLTQS